MKRFIVIFLVITGMSFLFAGCGVSKLSDAFDEDTVKKAAEQAIEYINDNDFDSVCAMFGDELKAGLTAEDLKSGTDKTIGDAGAFVEFKNEVIFGQKLKSTGEDIAVAVIVAKYENKKATYTISFDTDMKMIGIYIK